MDWRQPSGERARGSLLFAGGRSDFIEKYLETYQHWNHLGWNVTTFDWRGQGLSRGAMAPENPDSFDSLVDDLDSLIGDWRGDHPGPRVAIGHSMGGHLLLRTMVDRSPDFDAVVLVAPMLTVNSGPMPDWMAASFTEFLSWLGLGSRPMWKMAPALERPGSQRQRILTSSRERYEDELWWWDQYPQFRLPPPSFAWLRAAFHSSSSAFTRERLAGIETPVLLLGAERDRLVDPVAIRQAAAALPNAELEMFTDSGHEILRESDPVRDRALDRIDRFLDVRAP